MFLWLNKIFNVKITRRFSTSGVMSYDNTFIQPAMVSRQVQVYHLADNILPSRSALHQLLEHIRLPDFQQRASGLFFFARSGGLVMHYGPHGSSHFLESGTFGQGNVPGDPRFLVLFICRIIAVVIAVIFQRHTLSLIHISEPTRLGMISYAVFCLKKKKPKHEQTSSRKR